eukprot:gene4476-6327_t
MDTQNVSSGVCCVICLESHAETGSYKLNGHGSMLIEIGTCCPNGHFICNNDLVKYLSENVLTKLYELRKNNGCITCPSCDANLNVLYVYNQLGVSERIRFKEIVDEVHASKESNVRRIADSVVELLTLKCPKCKVAVDPIPDACSAIMCLNCGSHYCNYCFQGFDYGDTAQDRAEAHTHAASHSKETTNQSAFLPAEEVEIGQRIYLTELLKRFLRLAMTSKQYSLDGCHEIALAMVIVFKDLFDLQLDIASIWFGEEQALIVPQPTLTAQSNQESKDNALPQIEELKIEELKQDQLVLQGGLQLSNAIATSNAVACRQIIDSFGESLDKDYINNDGIPLLFYAILQDMEDCAIRLIKMGANPLAQNRNSRTCVYIAIEKGRLKLFEEIIKFNPTIDLNVPHANMDYYPLHVAVRFNQPIMVRRLLQCGLNLEVEYNDNARLNPLGLALILGYEQCAIYLLKAGARIDSICTSGQSALSLIGEKGLTNFFSILTMHVLQQSNNDYERLFEFLTSTVTTGGLSRTLLHVISTYDQNDVLELLLETLLKCCDKISVSHNSSADSSSPKSQETSRNTTNLSDKIKERFIDYLNIPNRSNNTAFITMLIHKNEYGALLLLKHGALFDTLAHNDTYPISIAAEKGLVSVVKELVLIRGVDINESGTNDVHGRKPLHHAMILDQTVMVKCLLEELGADVNAIDSQLHHTSLIFAVACKKFIMTKILLDYHRNFVGDGVCNGISLNAYTPQGRNPLYVAAEFGQHDIICLLLHYFKQHPDCNITRTDKKITMLHVAVFSKHPVTVEALLMLGADPMRCDYDGRNAAALTKLPGACQECAEVIRRHLNGGV